MKKVNSLAALLRFLLRLVGASFIFVGCTAAPPRYAHIVSYCQTGESIDTAAFSSAVDHVMPTSTFDLFSMRSIIDELKKNGGALAGYRSKWIAVSHLASGGIPIGKRAGNLKFGAFDPPVDHVEIVGAAVVDRGTYNEVFLKFRRTGQWYYDTTSDYARICE